MIDSFAILCRSIDDEANAHGNVFERDAVGSTPIDVEAEKCDDTNPATRNEFDNEVSNIDSASADIVMINANCTIEASELSDIRINGTQTFGKETHECLDVAMSIDENQSTNADINNMVIDDDTGEASDNEEMDKLIFELSSPKSDHRDDNSQLSDSCVNETQSFSEETHECLDVAMSIDENQSSNADVNNMVIGDDNGEARDNEGTDKFIFEPTSSKNYHQDETPSKII